jgi:putative SOS response-associated peptidase YedK
MCGRFTLTATPGALDQLFPSLFDGLDVVPQYNIAPTQQVLAVRLRPGSDQPEAVRLRWGLVPSWADDLKIGYRHINARVESVPNKPAFRAAYKQRHCLVLADGFYEWQKSGGGKQPYHLRLKGSRPFAFAGLWETWRRDDQTVQSCTILTTQANPLTSAVHDRMPVILSPEHCHHWLDAAVSGTNGASAYLGPYPAAEMEAVAVSTRVNSVKNNDPACLAPVAPAQGSLF